MTSLLDLPPETVQNIVPYVDSEDLESFTLSCKSIFRLGETRLKRHRLLKSKYNHYNCRRHYFHNQRSLQLGPIPDLLDDVLQDEMIGGYVKKLTIDWCKPEWDGYMDLDEQRDGDDHVPYHRDREARFRSMLIEHVLSENGAEDWKRAFKNGDEGSMLTVLLSRYLKNLNHLLIAEGEGLNSPDTVWSFIEKLPTMHTRPIPLSSLTKVTLYNIDGADDVESLNRLMLIAKLPSVKYIEVSDMIVTGLDTQSTPEFQSGDEYKLAHEIINFVPRSSNVETLHLTNSAMNPEAFSTLLHCFKSLRSFHFDNSKYAHDPEFLIEFDTYSMLKDLISTAKTTLEHLKILLSPRCLDSSDRFREFGVLRNLDIGTHSFYKSFGRDCPLAAALPASVQQICLRVQPESTKYDLDQSIVCERVLEALTYKRGGLLPELTDIKLIIRGGLSRFDRDGPLSYPQMCKEFQQSGIEFIVGGEPRSSNEDSESCSILD